MGVCKAHLTDKYIQMCTTHRRVTWDWEAFSAVQSTAIQCVAFLSEIHAHTCTHTYTHTCMHTCTLV